MPGLEEEVVVMKADLDKAPCLVLKSHAIARSGEYRGSSHLSGAS